MKQLLTLLATATVGTTIAPLTFDVALFSNTTTPTPKFTTLINKGRYKSFSRLSDTTALIFDTEAAGKLLFFDSTKVNTASKGIIDLNKKTDVFLRLSNTKGFFIDRSYQAYLFDSTQVNTASKGFTNLNHKGYYFYRMSDTTGIFEDIDLSFYFFDITTMKFTKLMNLEFIDFQILSETTGILKTINKEFYFFDSTKVNETSQGLVKFDLPFFRYFRLSDRKAVFWSAIGEAVLFDSTQINNSSQGLTHLEQKISDFYRLSDTTAVASDLMTNKALYFDLAKINDSLHGFTPLNKPIAIFHRLSDTTGLFLEPPAIKGNFKTYFFDSTQVNRGSQGFTLVKNDTMNFFYRLSDTVAFIRIAIPYYDGMKFSGWLFDSTQINNSSHGYFALGKMEDFFRMSDTTGIFTSWKNYKDETVSYFEYK